MTKEATLGKCPDCRQEYRDPEEVLPTPCEHLEVKTMPWAEWVAEVHRDNECPVQKERDRTADLEAALRYFGIPTTLRKIAEIIGTNEHDGEIIWGDADRWFKKEQADAEARSLTGGVRKFPAAVPPPEDEVAGSGAVGAPRGSHSQGTS